MPRFKTGPQNLTGYAVDVGAPARIFLTNGQAVMRTVDGACTWKEVFRLPDAPNESSTATAATGSIMSIDIAERANQRIVLMIEEQTPQGSRPHVTKSDDGGESWVAGSVGLPPSGDPEALVLAPSDPNLAFLAVDVGGGSVDFVFASTDGGGTWTLRSNPASITPNMGIIGLTVDPAVATSLWAYGTGGLYRSNDGGASFQAVPEFVGSEVNAVDIFHTTGAARILAFKSLEEEALISTNGGRTWNELVIPAGVTTAGHGNSAVETFITAGGRVYAFHEASFQWIDLQAPRGGLTEISVDRAGAVYARSDTTIEVYSGPSGRIPPENLPDDVFEVPLVNPPAGLDRRPPEVSPVNKRVVLDPGASKTVDYKLDLPKRPLPLNVFFLLDTSDSMGTTIGDLARSVATIINELSKRNIALEVGIGAFRAYPDHFPPRPDCDGQQVPLQGCEKAYVYKRVLDIKTPTAEVTTALETLESDSGGFYKSHLGALYQLATGAGQDLYPPGPAGNDVPPGLQANFDENSLRVVVHATDEAFGDDTPRQTSATDQGNPGPPDIPEFSEVADVLNANDIMQIGLSIGSLPRADLQRVARDTGSLAPKGGVDCGAGIVVPEGSPLVCPVKRNNLSQSHNLVPAIVNLLEAVPNSTDLEFTATGNEKIVDKVTPEQKQDVVLQIANEVPFSVTFRCPRTLAGKNFDIKVGVRGPGRVLDSVPTRVVCRAVPKDPKPVVPPPVLPLPLLFVGVPPPPPPPISQLTSASQAQSQAQAQTGAVFEEEKEPQLAVAAAYREAAQTEDAYAYEMTAYQRKQAPVSPYATLGAGAVMTSMAYAAMVLARQNSQVARQRRRRR